MLTENKSFNTNSINYDNFEDNLTELLNEFNSILNRYGFATEFHEYNTLAGRVIRIPNVSNAGIIHDVLLDEGYDLVDNSYIPNSYRILNYEIIYREFTYRPCIWGFPDNTVELGSSQHLK